MASNLVKFITCTAAAFAANEHDANALYFITDTQQLYKGDLLFSGGSFAAVSEFPETGVINTIYINTATGDVAYWNGTDYTDIVKTSSMIAENVDGDWEIKAGIPTCEAVFNFVEAANTALKTELSGTIEDLKNNVYTKTETDTAIANAVASAGHLKREIVDALPDVADGNEDTIYMVALADATGNNIYEEFMLINGSFEKIGSTDVDLTGYATETFVSEKVTSATESITTAYEAADATTLQDAKDYADSLADNYATAEQGAKADSALQPSDITTGDTEGTIFVGGLEVPVAGLGSAAFAKSSDFDAAGSADQALTDAKAYTDDAIANIELPDLPDSICTGIEEDSKKFLGQSAETGYWDLGINTSLGEVTYNFSAFNLTQTLFDNAQANVKLSQITSEAFSSEYDDTLLSASGLPSNYLTDTFTFINAGNPVTPGTFFVSGAMSITLPVETPDGTPSIESLIGASPQHPIAVAGTAIIGPNSFKLVYILDGTELFTESPSGKYIVDAGHDGSSVYIVTGTTALRVYTGCKIVPIEQGGTASTSPLDAVLTTDHISRTASTDLSVYDEGGKLKVSSDVVKQIVTDNSLSSEDVDEKLNDLVYCQAVGTDSQKFLSQSSTTEKWELNANTELVIKTSTGKSEPSNYNNFTFVNIESLSKEEKITRIETKMGLTNSYDEVLGNLLDQYPNISYIEYMGTSTSMYSPCKISFDKEGQLFLGIKTKVGTRPAIGFTVLDGPFVDYVVPRSGDPISSDNIYILFLNPEEVVPYEQYMYTIEQGDALLTTDHIARTEPSTLEVYDDNGKLRISENVIAAIAANALTWQEL